MQAKRFVVAGLVLMGCFAIPLWRLLRYSMASDFFSYIPLVPFISVYLIWCRRSKLPANVRPSWVGMACSLVAGVLFLGLCGITMRPGNVMEITAYLAMMTASFVCFLLGAAFYFLGAEVLGLLAFPVAFLAFFVPPPAFLLDPIVQFFQRTSAETAILLFRIVGTPVLSEGLVLRLPGIGLMVAPECSGIHSTMVLLITSFLAGNMFLQSNWKRAILVLIIVPLAILRNGFRIFVIGELCVHISPRMIDSPIHRHGGPLFFVLSLIPFFLLLVFLRRIESSPNQNPVLGADAVPTNL